MQEINFDFVKYEPVGKISELVGKTCMSKIISECVHIFCGAKELINGEKDKSILSIFSLNNSHIYVILTFPYNFQYLLQ